MSSTRSRSGLGRRAGGTSRAAARDTGSSSPRDPGRRDRRATRSIGTLLKPSSGHVYRDLGFSPAEAEYLMLRSRLMVMLARLIADRGLTQLEAAHLLGVSQPRVSDIARGRVERFTIDALVEMLARAGVHLDLVVLPASA